MYLTAQPNNPCMKPALFPAFARTKTRKPYSTRSAISREEMSENIVLLIFFCEGVSHDEIDHLRATHILKYLGYDEHGHVPRSHNRLSAPAELLGGH